jgi:hypothetical protein
VVVEPYPVVVEPYPVVVEPYPVVASLLGFLERYQNLQLYYNYLE